MVETSANQMTLLEAAGIVIFLAGILALAAYLVLPSELFSTDVNEKQLTQLSTEIQALVDTPGVFAANSGAPVQIQDDFTIIGFDKNYDPKEPMQAKATYFQSVGVVNKPKECQGLACLCMYKENELLACEKISSQKNIILTGTPFVNGETQMSAFFDILFTLSPAQFTNIQGMLRDYPMQNVGAERIAANRQSLDSLSRKGYSNEFVNWYGYFYLKGEIDYATASFSKKSNWGIRNVYIEKFEDEENIFVLLVPSDANYQSNQRLGSEIIKIRENQVQSETDTIRKNLLKAVADADNETNLGYTALLHACENLHISYPNEILPSRCSSVTRCKPKRVEFSATDCTVESAPCVCNNKMQGDESCMSEKYCYESGCSVTEKTDACGW